MSKKKNSSHLPLFGVGPVIVYGQVLITVIAVIAVHKLNLNAGKFDFLKIPFLITGILLIIFGFYLDCSAKIKSKLFKNVEKNRLVTDGVYAIVRNPVYSGGFLICTGIIFIANNLLLFIVPPVCWLYMTVFLIMTEEKWLKDLYGQEYVDYCKRVNRCIPWFRKPE